MVNLKLRCFVFVRVTKRPGIPGSTSLSIREIKYVHFYLI